MSSNEASYGSQAVSRPLSLRGVRWGVIGGALIVIIGVAFSVGVALQTSQLLGNTPDSETMRTSYQYQADTLTKVWTAIVQAIGALTLAIAGYVGWKNFELTRVKMEVDRDAATQTLATANANLEATKSRLDLATDEHATSRFIQAIGQLGAEHASGAPNLEVRLGAIYALERIAKDSCRDHWTIVEILTTYVRHNAEWRDQPRFAYTAMPLPDPQSEPPLYMRPREDIQAILTVLGRREIVSEPFSLYLVRLDLQGVDLFSARLTCEGRSLGPNFTGTHLEGARLATADLRWAHLAGASLDGANIRSAWVHYADLRNASLRRACLGGSKFVGAKFDGADLEDAELDGATLDGADLSHARNLTKTQIWRAFEHGAGATLPESWDDDWRLHFEHA